MALVAFDAYEGHLNLIIIIKSYTNFTHLLRPTLNLSSAALHRHANRTQDSQTRTNRGKPIVTAVRKDDRGLKEAASHATRRCVCRLLIDPVVAAVFVQEFEAIDK